MENQNTALITLNDMSIMADTMSKSGLFGNKTKDQFMALMLLAHAEGRHPALVALDYDVIQGRPALRSQVALNRFQESGGKMEYLERTDQRVSARFTHPKGADVTVTWDMARARALGYDTKDNWKKQPMIMLQWRCVAEGVRACYPACLSGQYLVEEVQDFDAPKTLNPKNAVKAVLSPDKSEARETPAQIENRPETCRSNLNQAVIKGEPKPENAKGKLFDDKGREIPLPATKQNNTPAKIAEPGADEMATEAEAEMLFNSWAAKNKAKINGFMDLSEEIQIAAFLDFCGASDFGVFSKKRVAELWKKFREPGLEDSLLRLSKKAVERAAKKAGE